jgi:glutamine synthetase
MTLAGRSGSDSPARQGACEVLLRRVSEERIESVRVAWCDLHGQLRSKTVVCGDDGAALRAVLDDGVSLVSTVLLKDSADRTAYAVFKPGTAGGVPGLRGFGPANNLLLLPDPATLLPLPWAPGTAWLRAEPFWPDGTAVAPCPRRALQRALAELAAFAVPRATETAAEVEPERPATGLALRCGLEVEFHIHRITDDRLGPDDATWPAEPPAVRHTHPGYHLLSDALADRMEEPLALVRRTALGLGLPLRSLEVELGPSQVEAVFAPVDALTAADQMVLLRNGLRQALRRAGYHASFVCRPPLAESVASGWHLHQSLVDAAGAPRLPAASPAGALDDALQQLSPLGAQWLAGLLAHAPGMAALCVPSIPAYARLQGSMMAPQAAVWGRDHRGAMLRVLGGPGDVATRIENRLPEPMANPYLAIAAQVWAGLDGLRRGLQPGPAADGAALDTAARLPTSLRAALDALSADRVLQQGLGSELGAVYDTVRRHELSRHAQAADAAAWERREYFSRF